MFSEKDLQAAQQLRRALQLFAASLDETQAREVATVYPAYAPGQSYKTGQYIRSGEDANGDPQLFRVVQDHVSQEDWPPDHTPALYTCVSHTDRGWPIWSPPAGAHDAYNIGAVVSHRDKLWRSERDGNTSEPGTDAWWALYEEV